MQSIYKLGSIPKLTHHLSQGKIVATIKKRSAKKTTNLINQPLDILNFGQLTKLATCFWAGGTITIGSIIIPLLFKTLDQITAATITGQILNINAYTGMVACIFIIIGLIIKHQLYFFKSRKFWYALSSEAILTVNYFGIFPIIANLRTKLADIAHHVIQTTPSFNFWHSLSSGLFVLTGLLAILIVLEK